jgi:hypothetical protein
MGMGQEDNSENKVIRSKVADIPSLDVKDHIVSTLSGHIRPYYASPVSS